MTIDSEKLGAWSFIAGSFIAIITAFISVDSKLITTVLVVLGFIVGLLNINDKDTTHFLVAVIALLAVGNVNVDSIPLISAQLKNMLLNIGIFVAPAAAIVALKAIYSMASGN